MLLQYAGPSGKGKTQHVLKTKGWRIQPKSFLTLVLSWFTGQVYMEQRCKGKLWMEWSSCCPVLVGCWLNNNVPILHYWWHRPSLKMMTLRKTRRMMRRDIAWRYLPHLLFLVVYYYYECLASFASRMFPRNPRFYVRLPGVGLNVSPPLDLLVPFLSLANCFSGYMWTAVFPFCNGNGVFLV